MDLSRRHLFSRRKSNVVRPPWSKPEAEFTDACTRCGACVDACETQVLIKGDGGFPELNFQRAECSFCQACVTRCAEPAFRPLSEAPWRLIAQFADNCLARQGIVCQSCKDACDERAIRFPPLLGATAQPVLDAERCSGCGACVAPCPASAIKLVEPDPA
ncbi:ferredoxin-type protein NapF [Shewanella algae]|uniref:ferredoxin-type protein NapF n=1 Tax=Shewanella algae TaxID=38313 RepID=UPI001AAC4B3C|nr:ferredoxin-type protein NapF [Shewanella algae]MBO2659009.1 ferredoxin-type protein NapF [Shewanella algae]